MEETLQKVGNLEFKSYLSVYLFFHLLSIHLSRFKKWGPAVIPHRKPRWVPMARSKMFVNPPTCLTPQVYICIFIL